MGSGARARARAERSHTMNIQTEKSIQNTYINPIVLPDYPCLEVKSVRKLSDWGLRGQKNWCPKAT